MTNPCSILKEFIWKHCICVLVLVAVAFAAANYKAVFAWLSYEFGNNLWNILTAIGTLTAAVVAYYALNLTIVTCRKLTFGNVPTCVAPKNDLTLQRQTKTNFEEDLT